jgi:hypothetical protein
MLTTDKKGNPIIEDEVIIEYSLAVGPTWNRFFEGLSMQKIFGTRCPACGRVLVPARAFCPRCFEEMNEWVELSQEGTVEGWIFVNYEYFGMPVKPPFVCGNIRLDGADCGFVHLIGGFEYEKIEDVRKHVHNGIRVRVEWNPQQPGNIFDIKHFKPIS